MQTLFFRIREGLMLLWSSSPNLQLMVCNSHYMKKFLFAPVFALALLLLGLLASCTTYQVQVSDPNELRPLRVFPDELTSGTYYVTFENTDAATDFSGFPENLENKAWLIVRRINPEEVHFLYFSGIPADLLSEFLHSLEQAKKTGKIARFIYKEPFIEITCAPDPSAPESPKTYRLERVGEAYAVIDGGILSSIGLEGKLNLKRQSFLFWRELRRDSSDNSLFVTKEGNRLYFYFRESNEEESVESAIRWNMWAVEILPNGDLKVYSGGVEDGEKFEEVSQGPDKIDKDTYVILPDKVGKVIDSGALTTLHFRRVK